jgi:four helix bundle suffix protein
MELKLTNVARASLEELRLDYQDFLRQRKMEEWPPEHPALMRFRAIRCATLEQVRAWVADERKRVRTSTDTYGHKQTHTDGPMASVAVRESPCKSVSPAQLVANAALSLLNVACHLLDRQLAAQAEAFEREGGFTERLYRVRKARRK